MAHKGGLRRTVVILVCVVAAAGVAGVYLVLRGWNLGDYTLDASTFDASHLAMVASKAGITFPAGTRGQNLSWDHSSSIDPSFRAKLEIPANAAKGFAAQLSKLPSETISLSDSSTKKKPAWWQPASATIVTENVRDFEACYVRMVLCHEQDKWILYVEWFSV